MVTRTAGTTPLRSRLGAGTVARVGTEARPGTEARLGTVARPGTEARLGTVARLRTVARATANGILLSLTLLSLTLAIPVPTASAQEVWTFDRIDRIGGHATTVLGHPHVIDTPHGKAVEFNGVDDGLQFDLHPLAGAQTFTWEAIFRPDGGNAEQRWFHLEENPATGSDTDNRMLFEIRVIDGRWCLDAFNKSGDVQKALLNRSSLHALGAWFHVAAVYDGAEFRCYIDGVEDGAAQIHLAPQGPGRTSVGVRINQVYYFKGAVRMARFTRRALPPSEFLKLPKTTP